MAHLCAPTCPITTHACTNHISLYLRMHLSTNLSHTLRSKSSTTSPTTQLLLTTNMSTSSPHACHIFPRAHPPLSYQHVHPRNQHVHTLSLNISHSSSPTYPLFHLQKMSTTFPPTRHTHFAPTFHCLPTHKSYPIHTNLSTPPHRRCQHPPHRNVALFPTNMYASSF